MLGVIGRYLENIVGLLGLSAAARRDGTAAASTPVNVANNSANITSSIEIGI